MEWLEATNGRMLEENKNGEEERGRDRDEFTIKTQRCPPLVSHIIIADFLLRCFTQLQHPFLSMLAKVWVSKWRALVHCINISLQPQSPLSTKINVCQDKFLIRIQQGRVQNGVRFSRIVLLRTPWSNRKSTNTFYTELRIQIFFQSAWTSV